MDIAALYFDLVEQKRTPPKRQKNSQSGRKQMNDGELAYWKREITKRQDETRGVCKLNWNSSYLHKAHVLARNYYGDKSMPDELWDYWVCYVKQVQEQLVKEGYDPDDKILYPEKRNNNMDRGE